MSDAPSHERPIDTPVAAPRRLRPVILLSLALLAAALLLMIPLVSLLTHLSLQFRLASGARHILIIESRLADDPRFMDVQFQTFPVNGGSILVEGELASEEDADLLRELVERSNPPLPVIWELSVQPPPDAADASATPSTQPAAPARSPPP